MVKKRNLRKTLENKLDKIYSLIIRRPNFCLRCGKKDALQCSHIHNRSKMSVRWDLKNAFCLCSGCHLYWWHLNPIEAAEFSKNILGIIEYNLLYERAMIHKKWQTYEMQDLLNTLEGLK